MELLSEVAVAIANSKDTDHTTPSGPGCSKLTTSLVNVSLKFQTLISEISQYFC